jgi:hypothetical protein
MKKLCLFITVIGLLSFNAAHAQLEKGTIMTGVASTISIGGTRGSEVMSLGLLSSNDDYKETILNLLPRGGVFIRDNWVAGLDIITSLYTEKSSDSDTKWSENIFGVGPFTRYYYPLEKIYPFGDFSVVLGQEVDKYKSASYETDNKYSVLIISLVAGVAKPIGDIVTLDVMAGYSRAVWNQKDGADGNGKDICSGLVIKAGFTIYLKLL